MSRGDSGAKKATRSLTWAGESTVLPRSIYGSEHLNFMTRPQLNYIRGGHLFKQVSFEIMVIFCHAPLRVNYGRHICLYQDRVNGARLLEQERVYLQLWELRTDIGKIAYG
jgi:hypothetical protein